MDRLRHELFARAGLAVDQHRRGGRRGLFDDAIDSAQRRRVADHLAEPAVVLELAAEARHVTQRVLTLGHVRPAVSGDAADRPALSGNRTRLPSSPTRQCPRCPGR